MTRLAVGTPMRPDVGPVHRSWAARPSRALGPVAVGAACALPQRADWWPLAFTALGVVFGFPLLTSSPCAMWAPCVCQRDRGSAALATAAVGALLHRQRPSPAFWACALLGTALVVAFALLRSGSTGLALPGRPAPAGRHAMRRRGLWLWRPPVAPHARRRRDLRWALVLSLPATVPLAALSGHRPCAAAAWAAFGYVAVFSMWLGFRLVQGAWRWAALVRVSQVQLVQPFSGMLFAVPLLGERLDAVSVGFGLAVMATVLAGRRMPSAWQT